MTNKLIDWYLQNHRKLPWRETTDPYRVWLSEIILQQTRVEQGLPYYTAFISAFPTVIDLANATEQEVMKLWQGLGYYSRARNLHATAKMVLERGGKFPETYEELLQLKGVGPYAAAAISSFCFNEVQPVLDGNVFRVMSRVHRIAEPIDKNSSRKIFMSHLHEAIPAKDPATFNQAIMELGALICTPKAPKCDDCPLQHSCLSANREDATDFPKKAGKTKVRDRRLHYLVIENNAEVIIHQRITKDIWQNLYDFPLLEGVQEIADIQEALIPYVAKNESPVIERSEDFKHILSHQRLKVTFWRITTSSLNDRLAAPLLRIRKSDHSNYPTPKLIENYLTSNPFSAR